MAFTRKTYNILKIIFIILALAINFYILAQALLPSEQSTASASPVVETAADVVNTFQPETIDKSNIPGWFTTLIRKLFGHFGLFAVSGIITSLAVYFSLKFHERFFHHYHMGVLSLIIGLVMAFGSELCQLIPSGRSCEIRDVLIDFSGYLMGFLLLSIILLILVKRHKIKMV